MGSARRGGSIGVSQVAPFVVAMIYVTVARGRLLGSSVPDSRHAMAHDEFTATRVITIERLMARLFASPG